jgi:hypothetical protein
MQTGLLTYRTTHFVGQWIPSTKNPGTMIPDKSQPYTHRTQYVATCVENGKRVEIYRGAKSFWLKDVKERENPVECAEDSDAEYELDAEEKEAVTNHFLNVMSAQSTKWGERE